MSTTKNISKNVTERKALAAKSTNNHLAATTVFKGKRSFDTIAKDDASNAVPAGAMKRTKAAHADFTHPERKAMMAKAKENHPATKISVAVSRKGKRSFDDTTSKDDGSNDLSTRTMKRTKPTHADFIHPERKAMMAKAKENHPATKISVAVSRKGKRSFDAITSKDNAGSKAPVSETKRTKVVHFDVTPKGTMTYPERLKEAGRTWDILEKAAERKDWGCVKRNNGSWYGMAGVRYKGMM
ncbi:hypothetical protein FPQ18DRAFT_308509 [Pyronema domesticum]|nr:hypothetical protein FPQ18DRAFT_308509 [Pyronema domesticum]